jgi:hypothetical protein
MSRNIFKKMAAGTTGNRSGEDSLFIWGGMTKIHYIWARRLSLLLCSTDFTRSQAALLEEIPDFELGGGRGIGSVNGVPLHGKPHLSPDGARLG